jgi:hypothetical protein
LKVGGAFGRTDAEVGGGGAGGEMEGAEDHGLDSFVGGLEGGGEGLGAAGDLEFSAVGAEVVGVDGEGGVAVGADWPGEGVVGGVEAGGIIPCGFAVAIGELAVRSGVEGEELVVVDVGGEETVFFGLDVGAAGGELEDDDGVGGIGGFGGDMDSHIVGVHARCLEGVFVGIGQQVGAGDVGLEAADDEGAVGGPLEDVEVEGVAFEGGVAPGLAVERGAGGAVDGVAVDGHPFADAFENAGGVFVDGAVAFGADVEEYVAPLGVDFGEELDEEFGGFVVVVPTAVAVGVVDGGDGFPVAAGVADFGGVVGGVEVVAEVVMAVARGAAIDHDGGVGFTDGFDDADLFRGGKLGGGVEPEDVGVVFFNEFEELGDGFAVDIFFDAFELFGVEVVPVGAAEEFAIAARVLVIPVVAGGVGVFPVEGVRVVEAEADAGGVAGVGEFLHGVAFEPGGVVEIVGGDFRRIHGEAVVVLGGDDEVFHAGVFKEVDPGGGVELFGVEGGDDVGEVLLTRNFEDAHDVFRIGAGAFALVDAAEFGVDAPVHEAAETGITPPVEALVAGGEGVGPPAVEGIVDGGLIAGAAFGGGVGGGGVFGGGGEGLGAGDGGAEGEGEGGEEEVIGEHGMPFGKARKDNW